MAGGRCCVGEDGKMKKGGERSMVDVFPLGTCGKSGQDEGNNWFLPPLLPSLN